MKKSTVKSILNNIINGADKVRCFSDSSWVGDEHVIEATKDGVTIELVRLVTPEGDEVKGMSVLGARFDIDRRSRLYFGHSDNIYEVVEEMFMTIIDQYDSPSRRDVRTIMDWLL